MQDSSDVIKDGRVRVVFNVPHEPQLEPLIQNQHVRHTHTFEGIPLRSHIEYFPSSPICVMHIYLCVFCRNTVWSTVPDTFWRPALASPATLCPASQEASSLAKDLRGSECSLVTFQNLMYRRNIACIINNLWLKSLLVFFFSLYQCFLIHCFQSLWWAKS